MVAYLALFAGLTIHQAAATSLFSFLFTGILGTWLYQRRGSIDWRISLPVCAAALVFGFLGAAVAAVVDPQPARHHHRADHRRRRRLHLRSAENRSRKRERPRAAAKNGCSPRSAPPPGFGSGFSGAGGPLFSVPLMVILRYVPLTAVATSQVLQIVAATSGSIENLRHGFIDFEVGAGRSRCSSSLGVDRRRAACPRRQRPRPAPPRRRAMHPDRRPAARALAVSAGRTAPRHAPRGGPVRFFLHGAVRVFRRSPRCSACRPAT